MADRGRVRSSLESKSSSYEDKDGQGNKFANDGSFMEMFRRKMEEEKAKKSKISSTETSESGSSSPPLAAASTSTNNTDPNRGCTPPAEEAVNKPTKPLTLPFVGKRRGATPILKTGAVKKARKDDEEDAPKKDAWSQYLAEVKKYKEQSCQEENKTRPLVK